MARFRQLKATVREMLVLPEQDMLAKLAEQDAQQLVGPLFSFLLAPEELVRWRAVTGLGATVARMADEDMERSRVVMRRFLWHMNEESGNVGWGIPESMGESMARHSRLAQEYYKKLASYVQCPDCIGDDNYMDHPPLREAVYWGLGRLAQVHPELAAHAHADLVGAVTSETAPASQGYAAWALGLIGDPGPETIAALQTLEGDHREIGLFRNGELEHISLGALTTQALAALE